MKVADDASKEADVSRIIEGLSEHGESWLQARLSREALPRRVQGIVPGFEILEVNAIGFPYLLLEYCWEVHRLGQRFDEHLSCLVDRCQGVSTTVSSIEFGEASVDAELPEAILATPPLERKARQHVMQMRRHRFKRRSASGLLLVSACFTRKPLWRVAGVHPQHGELDMLVDGINGGYYLM